MHYFHQYWIPEIFALQTMYKQWNTRGETIQKNMKKNLLVKQYKSIIFSNIGNEKYFCTNKALEMECKRGDNSIIKIKKQKILKVFIKQKL